MPLRSPELTLASLLPAAVTFGTGRVAPPMPPPPQLTLPIPYERQLLSQWCWAACAAMVSTNHSTQCQLGRAKFPHAPCPPTQNEDSPATLPEIDAVLTSAGRTPNRVFGSPPLSQTALLAHVNQAQPLQIGWSYINGGGHVIILIGYQLSAAGMMFIVHDPLSVTGGPHILISPINLDTARGQGACHYVWEL